MASFYRGAELDAIQVAQAFYQAGWRGEALTHIVGIVSQRESRNPSTGNASAGAHRTDTNRYGAASGDLGLAQINWGAWGDTLVRAGIIRSHTDLFDPVTNARAAKYIYDQAGFKPWSAGAGGWTANGNPLHGVNVGAAQQAVQGAANRGLLGADWNQGGAAAGVQTTGGAGSQQTGPIRLPSDTRLVQNDNGLFALYQIMPGLWINYVVPRDGSVVISGNIERLSNTAFSQKYGSTVAGGQAAELAEIPTGYGTYRAFLNVILDQLFPKGDPRRGDPEIMRIVAERAGRPDMTDAEFENRLRSTNWWRTHTEGQLQWNDLSEAERQLRLNDMASRMAQTWYQYTGQQIDVAAWVANGSKNGLVAIASGKMGFGQWTESLVKPNALKNPESPWSRQVREEQEAQRDRGVTIENTANQLRNTLERWGLQWDEGTIQTYARGLIEKTLSDDDVNRQIRAQAKALFPWKDEMQETIVAAAPWIETYNRVMERQGTLRTREIAQALTAGIDPWAFEQELKQSAEWRSTKNAQGEMYGAVAQLGQELGFENAG